MMCARFFHARLAWVIMTPLGRPVVPDVYINRCRSSPAALARRVGSGDDRRSPSAVHPWGLAWEIAGPQEGAFEAFRRLVGQLHERFVADEGSGFGVLEDVADLRGSEPPVDRHHDGAEVVGREDRLQELRAVVREQSHDIAGTDPVLVKSGRQARPTGSPSPRR